MTLRTRLILSYVLIVVICLGIAAASVLFLLRGYRDQMALNSLDDMTRPIAVQIKSLLRGQTTLPELWANAQEQSQNNAVFILFVDNKGNLLKAIYPGENTSQSFIVPGGLPFNISQSVQGVFSTADGEKYIYSAYPLGKTNISPPLRADTLVLCQLQGGTGVILASLLRPFLLAGAMALIISIIAAVFIARSVYKPIRSLSRAAENIAQGKYDQAVPVTGTDEIKGLAKNFNIMAARIKDSQQQLRHFVADVSHQLKSPLTSIQGFAQAIQDGTAADTDTRNKAAGIIADESRRMIRQVNELLELSRMQSGQFKLARESLNIQDIITQCQEIFALRLEEKKLTIKNEFEFAGSITGDADRLEDVFCNLLDNAIKNTPPQGEIRISSRNIKDHELEVVVADSGPGIPPEQIPYVFDRFQQSSGLRTGFGLGLAIAREIVLAHGGKIEISSSPGEGARFIITLPVNIQIL
jgi:two-component system, OmpR family, sensor kinase